MDQDGMEVGLSPGDFVFDAHPAHSPKKGMEVGLSPGDFVLDENPAFPPKGAEPLVSNFRPISTVAKRLDASRCHLVWM